MTQPRRPYRSKRRRPAPPIDHTGLAVWTDGSCQGNPGPGGFGWLEVRDGAPTGRTGSGSEPHATNQRMEIAAVLDALRTVAERPITVNSDSTYVVKCFTDGWWRGWIRNDRWTNSQGKPVANRDLWEPLIALVNASPGPIRWQWVKGHAGEAHNEAADALAVAAGRAQR